MATMPVRSGNPGDAIGVDPLRNADIQLLTLRDLGRLIRRRTGFICLVTLLGVAAIATLILRTPDYFDARARIEIDPESAQRSPMSGAQAVPEDPAYINTQVQMITSPALLRRVVSALDLEHDPIFLGHMARGGRLLRRILHLGYIGSGHDAAAEPNALQMAGSIPAPPDTAEAERLGAFVEELRGRITIQPVQETRSLFRETRLVDVIVRHQNPALAARVANGIIAALVSTNEEQTSEADRLRLENLTKRAVELQVEIRRSEARLAAYASAHEIVSLEPNQNTDVDRLISLSRQLLESQNALRLAEADYASVAEPSAAAAVAEDSIRGSLNEANGKLADLRAKRAQLLVTATEKWPEVKEVERQIEVVAQHISDLKKQGSEQAVAKSKAKLREAQIREQAQRTVFEQERAVVQTRNSASVTYRLMQQEVDTNRKILNGLLETVGTNEANKAVSINNLRVVDYAISPDKTKPQGPMRLAYIAIAGFLSLAFGIAGALLLGHLDDRVWSEKDLYDMVNVRPLGVISSAAAGSLSFPRRRSSADSRTLITHQRNFLMAEDFRRLRTSVFRAATRSPRTVLVTSSIAGEGKTTTAANVAISLARGGANTVLVDADLHCPRQHLIFGLDNQAGLSSLLTGAAPMSDVDRLVHRDSSTGLSVLPCGPGINDPAEHLAGDRFRQLLANLTRRYECVIVDAPSVESCVDALLLAPHVDGVLMVVQTGKSQRDLVRRACHDIEAAGGTILGVILNRVHDPARKRYLYAPAAGPQVS